MSEVFGLVEQTFRDMFNAAVTRGARPRRTAVLGPATWAAIDVLAQEHPDATADHFASAHDAFALEHGDPQESAADQDPLTARATEFAAIDTLVAHLKISYPDIDPAEIDTVVRHIHRGYDDHAVREFIPLFVERAAHRRLA